MAADARPLAITADVLRGQRRSLGLWAVALTAIAAIYVSFYPAMGGGAEIEELMGAMPEGLADALGYSNIGSAAGYVGATVFGVLGPVLLLVFAIGTGTRLLAGGEEDTTLELELAAPVSRSTIYVERLTALWVDLVTLAVVATVATGIMIVLLDLDVEVSGLAAGGLGLLLLAGAVGTLAYAAGAATGRRSIALGVGSGVAVTSYVLNAVGEAADLSWMLTLSPWTWFVGPAPVMNGFDAGVLRLAVLAAVAVAGGLWRFERRDLMV